MKKRETTPTTLPDKPKEKTLYWTIMGRPRGTPTWMQVPYIPQKGRCANHFATQTRAEKCAAHLADRANPTWLPTEKSWVPLEYTVARVSLPAEPAIHRGRA